MSYSPEIQNFTSVLNSTSTPLASGATFQGTGENVEKWGTASVSVFTPFGESTSGVITIEVSRDGTNWGGPTRIFADTAVAEPHMWTIAEKYFRVSYTNNSAEPSVFQLQTQYSVNRPIQLAHQLNQTLTNETEAIIVKSVAIGADPNGTYVNQAVAGYVTASVSTSNLASGATFDTGIIDIDGYSQIETRVASDVAGSVVGSWYTDSAGTDLVRTFTRPFGATEGYAYFSAPVFAPYAKFIYTNGVSAQTDFYFSVNLRTESISGQVLGLEDFIPSNVVANLGRNITAGRQPDGDYVNTPADGTASSLATAIASGATVSSGWIDTDGFNSVRVVITSDQLSADNGLIVEYTDDVQATPSATTRITEFYTYRQSDVIRGYLELNLQPKLDGLKWSYTNGASACTFFGQLDLKTNVDSNVYNTGRGLIVGDFKTEVAVGNINNYSISNKFGITTSLGTGGPDTVWALSAPALTNTIRRKTMPTSSAEIFISSSSTSDTSKDITVEYLDSSLNLTTKTVTLLGQTQVSIGIGFDSNRGFLSSSLDTLVGDVYIYKGTETNGVPDTDTSVLAYIGPTYGRTQQATYTVPNRKNMVISAITSKITRANGSAGSAIVNLNYKPNGGSWQILRPLLITTSTSIDRTEQLVFSTGDQIEFYVTSVSDTNTNCSVMFEYQLIDVV